MKKLFKSKNFMTMFGIIIATILILLGLTGCNKQIIDLKYTYNKAICNIGGTYKEIEIKKWNDYEGEQLQIIDKDNNVYLVSSFNCTLINEEK